MPSKERFPLTPWRPIVLDDLIRLGRDVDGGYVLPRRCIVSTKLLVGLGISDDWSFEEAFAAANPGVSVLGVDATVSVSQFRSRSNEAKLRALVALGRLRVSQARSQHASSQRWSSRARDLAAFFDNKRHRLYPKHIADVASLWEITWRELVEGDGHNRHTREPLSMFVKMDIEGSEYRVLEDVLADFNLVNGLVVEFHDVDMHWGRFTELMDRATECFAVAHVHGNNFHPPARGSATPRVLEISFINRRLLQLPASVSTASYPLAGLDRPCDPNRPDHVIQF